MGLADHGHIQAAMQVSQKRQSVQQEIPFLKVSAQINQAYIAFVQG